jgi:hypothetical protein
MIIELSQASVVSNTISYHSFPDGETSLSPP